MPNFSRVATQLNKKLRNDQPLQFQALTETRKDERGQLESLLTKLPVLALQQADVHVTIDKDTYDTQLGWVLLKQPEEGTLQPVGYWSSTQSEPEKKLETTLKECVVVVGAVLLLRLYQEGSRIIVRTDHEQLKWFSKGTKAAGKLIDRRLRPFGIPLWCRTQRGCKTMSDVRALTSQNRRRRHQNFVGWDPRDGILWLVQLKQKF